MDGERETKIERPTKGERYRVTTPFTALVLIQWRAPMTTGGKKELPVGLEFMIDADPRPTAKGAWALPDPYDVWEKRLVSQTDWDDEKYNGYYLDVAFDDLAQNCIRL